MQVEILFLFAIVFANARTAIQKGKSSLLWGLITFITFMLTYALVSTVFVLLTYRGPLTPEGLQGYIAGLQGNLLKSITLAMFGLGGGLIIRYVLQRMPTPGGPPPSGD